MTEPVYLKVGEQGRILHLTDVQSADKQSMTRLLTVLHEKIGDLLAGHAESLNVRSFTISTDHTGGAT